MKTTKRFEEAVTKLYKAFHEGTLDAMDCQHCAVGNLVGSKNWVIHGIPIGEENRIVNCFENKTGYSRKELTIIEHIFIFGSKKGQNLTKLFSNSISKSDVISFKKTEEEQKELQFKGLCAVIKYLAELDNIPDPTDYSKLFETENNEAKYELIF